MGAIQQILLGIASQAPDILWWKFTDGSGSTVTAAVGPNGTTNATWGTTPAGKGQLTFNGSSHYLYSVASVAFNVQVATVCANVRWDSFTNNDMLMLETTANSNGQQGAIMVNPNASNSSNVDVVLRSNRNEGGTRPAAGVYRHYAFVFDNSTAAGDVKWYLDGIEQSLTIQSNTKTASGNLLTAVLYVMNRGGTGLFAGGRVSDFRIYGRELTAAEILIIKNNPA
jgi:hypothetical protein